MLHGAGYNEPRSVMASGFVTINGKALSTSRNRAVWADDYLAEDLHPDLLRYYLATSGGFQQDVDFRWDRFAERVNGELVGTLGNFIYRSLLFADRNYGGTPDAAVSDEVETEIADAMSDFEEAINDYSLRRAGDVAVKLAQFGNEYIQRNEPWKLTDEDAEAAAGVIRDCVQLSKAVAVLSAPVLPGKAEDLWSQLGEDGSVHDATIGDCLESPPAAFDEPAELFEGLDDDRIAELEGTLEEQIEAAEAARAEDESDAETEPEEADATDEFEPLTDDRISFEGFQELDVRVGRIESAEPVEGADKLVKLQVDIGLETRQVVAGIRQLHDLYSLPGTKVVVVANLEKAELFGEESNGMVLAAGEEADLLTTHGDSEPGTKVR
jgi:methionyl-tRNA synthetase